MNPTRPLIAIALAGTLLLGACGSDDDGSATSTDDAVAEPDEARPEPADETTDDEMTDDETTDDEMTDDEAMTDGLVAELAAAGLTDDEARCVVDGAVAEWGEEALLGAGPATDAELVRLGQITFDCIG